MEFDAVAEVPNKQALASVSDGDARTGANAEFAAKEAEDFTAEVSHRLTPSERIERRHARTGRTHKISSFRSGGRGGYWAVREGWDL